MKKESLVSIIIPVYNSEKTIKRAIESVKNQSYTNWELFLVDDCSTDDSLKIIRTYNANNIHIIHLESNSGAAKARNMGIKAASGKYLAFLDADDIWDINKLKKQIDFMCENKCAFSYTGYEYADNDGISTGRKVHVPKKINYSQAIKNTTIFTSTVMFDLDRIEKSNIYMVDVKSEDTATWWNILKKIKYAYGLDESMVYYCRSRKTLSSNKMKAIYRIWKLYRKTEGFGIIYSFYNFCWYSVRALLRRVR